MKKGVLYAAEAVFLLLFWTYMFRYAKPGLAVTAMLLIAFAAAFTLLDKHATK